MDTKLEYNADIPIYLNGDDLKALAKVLLAVLRQGKDMGWKVPDDLMSEALYRIVGPEGA
jgi:hypothetical protein